MSSHKSDNKMRIFISDYHGLLGNVKLFDMKKLVFSAHKSLRKRIIKVSAYFRNKNINVAEVIEK